jgi:hypothetical protein
MEIRPPLLMDFRVQQAFDFGEGQALELLGNLAGRRDLYADEPVAFAVLAGAGFEEPGEDGGESVQGQAGGRSANFDHLGVMARTGNRLTHVLGDLAGLAIGRVVGD